MTSFPWLNPMGAPFALAMVPADWLSLLLGLAAAGVAVGAAIVYRHWLVRTRAELSHLRGRINVLVQDLDRAKRRTRTLAVMAKSAKAVRNEFLSSISHEVRTPMNTIMGMTDLALSTDVDAKQRRYLEQVRAAADSLLGLLNDLLDLSKIHARRLRLDVQDFRLRDCIADVVGRYRVRAEQKGLAFECGIAEDVPDTIVGDPGRLRQVLSVLLSNALKFTDEGRIAVRVGVRECGDEDAVLEFAVTDTGIGIPEEMQEAVFEAFRQADGSVTRAHGGCGIGLSIASELVAMMGGDLRVQSRPGQGSTFRFTGRFGRRGERQVPQRSGNLSRLNGLRVLVVNGQQEMREALVGMLVLLNADVLAEEDAEGGRAALAQARADGRPFRVAVLDASLAHGSAFDLARRLCEDAALGRPKALIVTHAGTRGEAARCREAGVAAYLTFPMSMDELAQCLLMVHDRRGDDAGRHDLITIHRVREQGEAAARSAHADGEPEGVSAVPAGRLR
jgi:signal transduction histidine kinase/DNA-binding NarL/FixJ family response regulator